MNTPPEITKADALRLYDGNQAALGRALGVTRQAINKMPDGPLAERFALKLAYVLHPGVFSTAVGPENTTDAA